MASDEREKELLTKIHDAVVAYDEETSAQLCNALLKEGIDPYDGIIKIVMGVIEGDIHDIGKTLVKTMFEAAGWEIYDLGKDVKLEKFVEELKRTKADVVALSALMTTSMLAMPKVIEMLKAQVPDVIIMVGGAPLSPEIAKQYGADGYARDAIAAVQEADRLFRKVA
jgi:methylmalonyl-CoA mutase cobalamin-binding domain/chain